MTTTLPLSSRLAWWGTAWLRGSVGADELMDEVAGASSLLLDLARWRSRGCTGLALALPVGGDPLGLRGPAAFHASAHDAGEAVLVLGLDLGLVPEGDPVAWTVHTAHRGVVEDVGEADRSLRRSLLDAAARLAELDVARWRPEAADALANLRHRPHVDHPVGVPARCVDLAARALQAAAVVQLALDDDGAAVSAYEVDARRSALAGLDRSARRALVAACSADAWPPTDA